jgi:hypothetical protein
LGGWKKATVPTTTFPALPVLAENVVYIVNRPSAVQTVLSIGGPVNYAFHDPAFVKARLMNDVLGGGSSARLFNNLRERHGYTYGAYSNLNANKYIGSFTAGASVRTAVTDSAVQEFISEMQRIGTEAVADSELTLSRNGVSGSFINSLESPQTVANFAINTVRYNLAPDYYKNYLKTVAAVSQQDILEQGKRFVNPKACYIVAVGNAQEISSKLGRYGEVKYVDEYGNPVDANPLRPVPAGVTAQIVVDQYLAAIGGKDAINKLRDYSTTYTGEVQGNPFTLDAYRKRPNKATTVASIGPNEIDRTATDGKISVRKGQGGVNELTGKELQNALTRGIFFWETNLVGANVTANLLGVEKVNNSDAYKIEFKYPSGDSWLEYYDATSHLRIRKIDTRTTPNGSTTLTTDFGDYTKITGTTLLIPGTVKLPIGPSTVNLTLKHSKANTKLDDSIFELKK